MDISQQLNKDKYLKHLLPHIENYLYNRKHKINNEILKIIEYIILHSNIEKNIKINFFNKNKISRMVLLNFLKTIYGYKPNIFYKEAKIKVLKFIKFSEMNQY